MSMRRLERAFLGLNVVLFASGAIGLYVAPFGVLRWPVLAIMMLGIVLILKRSIFTWDKRGETPGINVGLRVLGAVLGLWMIASVIGYALEKNVVARALVANQRGILVRKRGMGLYVNDEVWMCDRKEIVCRKRGFVSYGLDAHVPTDAITLEMNRGEVVVRDRSGVVAQFTLTK